MLGKNKGQGEECWGIALVLLRLRILWDCRARRRADPSKQHESGRATLMDLLGREVQCGRGVHKHSWKTRGLADFPLGEDARNLERRHWRLKG